MKPDEHLLLLYSSASTPQLASNFQFLSSCFTWFLFFPPSEYIWANCLLLIEAFTAFSVLLLLLLRVEKNA